MLRKTLFWTHLAAGLLAALPLGAMALTGVLLSFEHQIVDALRPAEPAPSSGPRLPLDTLVVRAAGPGAGRVTAASWEGRPGSTVELRLGREEVLRVDPATGALLGRTSGPEKVFATVERLHRWLGSRELGGKVTGVSVLLCLLLSATGLVLWWPRSLRALARVAWPRRGLRGKARDWQWHNAVGVLVLPCLAILSLTGTVMSWNWAESLLYAATGSESPRRESRPRAGVAPARGSERPGGRAAKAPRDRDGHATGGHWQAWSDSLTAHAPAGWTSVRIAAPQGPGAGATAMFRTSTESAPSGGTATLSPDGSFRSWKPARTDLGTRIRFLVKPLHTGELFGLAGQAAMALASCGAILLAWTGVAMSWRRFRPRRA